MLPIYFTEKNLAEATGLPVKDAWRLMFLARRSARFSPKLMRVREPYFGELVRRYLAGEVTLDDAPSLDEIRVHWLLVDSELVAGTSIYFIQTGEKGPIKIGLTALDVQWRLAALQTGSPYKLRVLATIPGSNELEKRLHRMFRASRLAGEWFRPTKRLVRLVERLGRRYAGTVQQFPAQHVSLFSEEAPSC